MTVLSRLLQKLRSIPVTVKASLAYTLCSILQRGLSFITLPLFTRLLTTTEYGMFSIYSSWSGILAIFITLNLQYGSFSKAMVKYEKSRDSYISSMQGIVMLLAGCFLLVYLPFRAKWNILFELPTIIMLVMVAEATFHMSVQMWSGKQRFNFKYISVIVVTLLTSVLSPLLAYVLVMHSNEKGYARILGYAIVAIAFGIFFMIYNFCKGKTLYDKTFWHYAFSFNLPLIIYYLSQTIFNQSDRIMISHMIGTDKAGIYGVAYSLSMILTFVLNAINNSYVPWYYTKLKENKEKENVNVAIIIAVIMGVLILAVIWLAPEIILIMAGEKYMEAIWIVPPVSMSLMLLFYAQLCINVEFYFEKKKHLVFASVGCAIVNIILNALLIPIFGYIAAGYTTLLSYVLFVAMNYISMKKVLKEVNRTNDSFNVKIMLLILVVFVLIGFLGMALYSVLIVRLVLVLLTCIVILIKRKLIIKQVKYIFSFK